MPPSVSDSAPGSVIEGERLEGGSCGLELEPPPPQPAGQQEPLAPKQARRGSPRAPCRRSGARPASRPPDHRAAARSARQRLARRVLGLGRHGGDARGFVDFPVAALALLAAVKRDLTLRALAQRGAAALRLAEEAAEEVDPEDGLGAGLLGLAKLLLGRRCLLLS